MPETGNPGRFVMFVYALTDIIYIQIICDLKIIGGIFIIPPFSLASEGVLRDVV